VIILAGPQAHDVLDRIFQPAKGHDKPACGALQLGQIHREGQIIDQAIICRRQRHIEINIHGGPVVAAAVMELLAGHGVEIRPVGPGAPVGLNPSHPSWNNPAVGAEMLEVLPQARSELVVAAISNQWSGGLSRLARQALASDHSFACAAAELFRAAEGLTTQQKLLTPPQVVIAGPPNVGKSTLANALAGRQISIVHDAAGTTRDWVRELAIVSGVPIDLTDTAGLWTPTDDIDAEAAARARRCAREADLVLLVSAESPVPLPPWLNRKNVLRIAAKCDLHDTPYPADVSVSALTGRGLDQLKRAILAALGMGDLDVASAMAFTPRQSDLLTQAAQAMQAQRAKAACEALVTLLEG